MEILNRRCAVMEFVHQIVKERFWDKIFCLNTPESLYSSAHSQMETGINLPHCTATNVDRQSNAADASNSQTLVTVFQTKDVSSQ
jgi:hypothetical protein